MGNWIFFVSIFVGLIVIAIFYDRIIPPVSNLFRKLSKEKKSPNAKGQLEYDNTVTTGQKIAGAVFLFNAVFAVLNLIFNFNIFALIFLIPIFFDLVIGITFLTGLNWFLKFAVVRVVLGLFVWTGISINNLDYFSAIMQVVFSASLLLYMIGDAAKKRIIFASFLCIIIVLNYSLFIIQTTTGKTFIDTNAFNSMFMPDPVAVVSKKFGYKFGPLSYKWKQRSEAEIKKDNPSAEKWFVDTKQGGHITVVSQKYGEDQIVNHHVYKQIIIKNLQNFKISNLKDYKKNGMTVTSFNAEGKLSGLNLKYLFGIYSLKNKAIQLVCFSSKKKYPEFSSEFEAILKSFHFIQKNKI